jgi:hypothetical protein
LYAFFNRALLPHVVFWVLLGAGWWMAELSYRQMAIAIALWVVAILFVSTLPFGGYWMTAMVAIIDIALILKVFKGDIRVR